MGSVELDTADTVEFSAVAPVFVDPSGRRRTVLRRFVVGACVLVGLYVAVLAAALLGAPIPSSALLPLPAGNTPAPEQARPAAPSGTSSAGARASAPGPRPEGGTAPTENAPPQRATVPHSVASVVVTTPPPVAVTNPPAGAAPPDNRNSHAPAVPPGKDTTGHHP